MGRKMKMKMKKNIFSFRTFIKDFPLPTILDFFRWKCIDLYRYRRYGRPLHLYGIYGFVGQNGGGKTMGVTMHLDNLRKRFKDSILIYTNYYYFQEDGHINDWHMLLKEYDKPVIFVYDEIQNVFNSRSYKSFPIELVQLLTQNRKGHGKQILYTAPDYETVEKNFRRLTFKVVTCRTIAGRLTSLRYYRREDYENLIATASVSLRMKIHPTSHFYKVQSDEVRNHYDSFQFLHDAKTEKYIDTLHVK